MVERRRGDRSFRYERANTAAESLRCTPAELTLGEKIPGRKKCDERGWKVRSDSLGALAENDMKTWDAALYDNKLAMVARYGDGLLDMLDPTPGERILDLGCGTGRHARMIADRGAEVLGIDRASSMIEQARASFPELEFRIEDGESFRIDSPFDGVFSNAALHWMTSPEKVVRRVWEALRPGGRFVLEMGGQDNLLRLRAAIRSAMRALGYGSRPSLGSSRRSVRTLRS